MKTKNRTIPVPHPGITLKEDFLVPNNLSQYALAKGTGMSYIQVSEIVRGKRRITPESALRLAAFTGASPKFWLNLQNDFDLRTLSHTAFARTLDGIAMYRAAEA